MLLLLVTLWQAHLDVILIRCGCLAAAEPPLLPAPPLHLQSQSPVSVRNITQDPISNDGSCIGAVVLGRCSAYQCPLSLAHQIKAGALLQRRVNCCLPCCFKSRCRGVRSCIHGRNMLSGVVQHPRCGCSASTGHHPRDTDSTTLSRMANPFPIVSPRAVAQQNNLQAILPRRCSGCKATQSRSYQPGFAVAAWTLQPGAKTLADKKTLTGKKRGSLAYYRCPLC